MPSAFRAAAEGLVRFAECPPFRGEAGFQPDRAVAVVAGPALRAVQIAAAASRVRVLDFQEIEIFFPVWTLFGERR